MLLSLPVAATGALQTLLGFVDTRMVSEMARYPVAALPALGAGRTLMFFVSSIFMGLGVLFFVLYIAVEILIAVASSHA